MFFLDNAVAPICRTGGNIPRRAADGPCRGGWRADATGIRAEAWMGAPR